MVDFAKDSGLITRQELVSMIPPILTDIKSHHSVFDMCAAPGSKTAQILEQIMNDHMHHQKKSNINLPKGFVVANDADHKRAYLLTHQINRFNTSNIAVTNHMAQEFPNLYNIN
jgi:multisite-specific tRNA:(cytosine-C5)-methyltransferase